MEATHSRRTTTAVLALRAVASVFATLLAGQVAVVAFLGRHVHFFGDPGTPVRLDAGLAESLVVVLVLVLVGTAAWRSARRANLALGLTALTAAIWILPNL